MDRILIFLVIVSLFGLSSCYYDVEDELYAGCDTTAVSYTDDVWPIIEGNCLTACHGPGGSATGHIFTDHASVLAKVTNGSMQTRVVDQQTMPPNGGLTACQVDKIGAWILNGAPNN